MVGAISAAIVLIAATAALAATINGTPGPDTLVGTPQNDVINGFGGDDRIVGLAGRDRIDGGRDDNKDRRRRRLPEGH